MPASWHGRRIRCGARFKGVICTRCERVSELMELIEIVLYAIASWPFVLGLIVGGAIGIVLSLLTTGEINTVMSASLACVFGLLFTFFFSGEKKEK